MKSYGIVSVCIFLVSALVYIISMFFNDELLPGSIMLFMVIILPCIGLILAFKEQRRIKIWGLIGNFFVLFIAGIIPAFSVLFWNTP